MPELLLRVDGLTLCYGSVTALQDVSLKVCQGEMVSMIGANGAGKTSTLLSISGILSPICGQIFFNSEDISKIPANERVAKGLALVPEGRKIFGRLTVLENLQMGAYLRSDSDGIKADLNNVFELFPVLTERQSQLGGTLSGGEQQMLAISRALMSRPKMLLLDEPSMGIAPLLTERIFETLEKLSKSGLTILLVEQNAQLALGLSSRGYVMENGKIVLEDASTNLLSNSKVKEAYLGG